MPGLSLASSSASCRRCLGVGCAAPATSSANPIERHHERNRRVDAALSARITLAVYTAATAVTGPGTWSRFRRMVGLFAFFYGALHFLVYVLLDQNVDGTRIIDDIAKRPFITVGFTALVLMLPLALTSRSAAVRRLGFRRWQRLHQLGCVAGVLAVIHFIWRVKIDVSQPVTYAVALGVLFLIRVAFWLTAKLRAAPT